MQGKIMPVHEDINRGRKVAELLYRSFATTGIHGYKNMPEDLLPAGVTRGSLEHILFITHTVAIDYQRDANSLWAISCRTYEDPDTRYLFSPEILHTTPSTKIKRDLQRYKLTKKPEQDANTWITIGNVFCQKWQSDPRNFLASCNWSAPLILARLKNDSHLMAGKRVPDYPFLRGDKIGPLWVRMLRDNAGVTQIQNLDKTPIPVDIHIARATLALGIVRGQYKGPLDGLFETIRRAWFTSCTGLVVDERKMIALDVDEPLWHLSKYGCTYRNKLTSDCPMYSRCEAKDFCIQGKVSIENNYMELET
jgi:hypothetical protein